MSILVIDGIKYEAWTPTNEDEIERMVKEHARDIFGEQSIYFEKHKLRTKSGIGSIPDGYVVIFGGEHQWHIVEVELSTHPLYEHIVPQISKFINGIKNLSTQRDIVDALYQEIDSDDFLKPRLKKAIGATETHKFLSDLVSKPPVVTIIIEKHTGQLDEAIEALRHPQIKVVEFQTFIRDRVGLAVHAHLFEPLFIPTVAGEPEVSKEGKHEIGYIELELKPYMIEYGRLFVPKEKRALFPDYGSPLELETDVGIVKTRFEEGGYIWTGTGRWFGAHPELTAGQKLIIEVIEPMRRYRLKIA
jgi:hypothetical protein